MKPLLAWLAVAVIAVLLWLGLRSDEAAPRALESAAVPSTDEPVEPASTPARQPGSVGAATATDPSEPETARALAAARPDVPAVEAAVVDAEVETVPVVRVRVIDRGGRPVAGVPVALRLRRYEWTGDEVSAPTDAEGRVDVPLAGRDFAADSPWQRASVALALPLEAPVEHAVDVADPPRDVVELVLPPTGSVRVVVANAPAERRAQVWLLRHDPTRSLAIRGRPRPGDGDPRALVDGEVRFAFVGLGMELWTFVEAGPVWVEEVFRGPEVPGQEVLVRLDLESAPFLTGVLVDESGAPFAAERVQLALLARTGDSSMRKTATVITAEDGRFRHEVDPHLASVAELSLSLEHPAESARPEAVASAPVSTPLQPGANDVGRLVLAPPPLVVSGFVVDDAGRPVPGASISLERPMSSEPGAEPLGWALADHGVLSAQTGGRGGFLIRGLVDEPRLAVRARHPDYLEMLESVRFAPGAEGVNLVLRRGAAIEGSVLHDADIPRADVRVAVQYPTYFQGMAPRKAGVFRRRGLPAGVVNVTAGTKTDPELVVVEGVTLAPGETCRDPRLQGLDLRGKLARLRIDVREPGGAPAHEGEAWLLGVDDPPRWSLYARPLSIVTARRAVDVGIHVPGFSLVELRNVDGDRVVELEPGPRVRLVLTGADVPEPPFWLSVRLGRPGVARTWNEMREFGPDGAVEVLVSEPGEYLVQWQLMRRSSSSGGTVHVEAERPSVTVTGESGIQELEVRLDPDALRRAIERAGG